MSLKNTCNIHYFLIDYNFLVHYHLSPAKVFFFSLQGKRKTSVQQNQTLSPQSLRSMLSALPSLIFAAQQGNENWDKTIGSWGNILHVHPGLQHSLPLKCKQTWVGNKIRRVKGKVLQRCHQTYTGSTTHTFFFPKANIFFGFSVHFDKESFFFKTELVLFWVMVTLTNSEDLSSCLSWA